jgi:tRNA (cmo5U34)-methyltransferase
MLRKNAMADIQHHTFKPQSDRDGLFLQKNAPRRFEFNADVAKVFDDMVLRSIPMYSDVLNAVIEWQHYYAQPDSYIYDLGCSTGSTIYAIASSAEERLRFVGIDNSQAMLDKAQSKLQKLAESHDISLRCSDVTTSEIKNASMVIMNYTLQFLPVIKRKSLLENIFRGLKPGGLLFMSEKLRSNQPVFQDTMTKIYEDFKYRNGYSRSEIELKKEALDNVLIPFTPEEHAKLLREVGFAHSEIILRWHNFASFVAIKQ